MKWHSFCQHTTGDPDRVTLIFLILKSLCHLGQRLESYHQAESETGIFMKIKEQNEIK